MSDVINAKPNCPECGSNYNVISKGYNAKRTKRRYLCKSCGKYFTEDILTDGGESINTTENSNGDNTSINIESDVTASDESKNKTTKLTVNGNVMDVTMTEEEIRIMANEMGGKVFPTVDGFAIQIVAGTKGY